SPRTTPFRDPLIVPPVKRPVTPQKGQGFSPVLTGPPPTIAPNTAINPATGLPFEGRTRAHQAFGRYPGRFPFPPPLQFEVHQRPFLGSVHSELPLQPLWGFDGISPGPTFHARYGEQLLLRNFNDLPANAGANDGFGLNQVSTHVHNGHTPSESDGFPCDFFRVAQYYDHHHPKPLAGVGRPAAPVGQPREATSTSS